jgi:hypothetical protein
MPHPTGVYDAPEARSGLSRERRITGDHGTDEAKMRSKNGPTVSLESKARARPRRARWALRAARDARERIA